MLSGHKHSSKLPVSRELSEEWWRRTPDLTSGLFLSVWHAHQHTNVHIYYIHKHTEVGKERRERNKRKHDSWTQYVIHREYEQPSVQFPVLAWTKVELSTMWRVHSHCTLFTCTLFTCTQPRLEHSSFLFPSTFCGLTLRGRLVTWLYPLFQHLPFLRDFQQELQFYRCLGATIKHVLKTGQTHQCTTYLLTPVAPQWSTDPINSDVPSMAVLIDLTLCSVLWNISTSRS